MNDYHPVLVPHENVNDESVKILRWLAADKTSVTAGQAIAELETSKASMDVQAPVGGFVRLIHEANAEVPVGGILCYICSDAAAELPKTSVIPPTASTIAPSLPLSAPPVLPIAPPVSSTAPSPAGPARFSAKAKELVAKHGLDERQFAHLSLVRAEDVLAIVGRADSRPAASAPSAPIPAPAKPEPERLKNETGPVPATGVPFRTESLPRSKQVEARYLRAGSQHTLSSMVSVACPSTGFRAAIAQQPILRGATTAIFVFEASRLLLKYPYFNAFCEGNNANYYGEINIGVAMDAGKGLKVPVIRRANEKSLSEIADELRQLLVRYNEDTIPVSALAGGTFTISDLSGDGAFVFLPLINQGQSAILGIGGEYFLPRCPEGLFPLILAFDHQVSEGRQAVRFLSDLRERMAAYETVTQGQHAVPASAKPEPHCERCMRSNTEIKALPGWLIRCVGPDGADSVVCSVCLAEF